jgi:hypothetical protein
VRGLSRACRTQRRLHGDIEISIVGLQHADRYISVVNTDTAQWSRPDLLCLVAGLGVVAVEERALLGSCDRRTAVGRRDYAVIITLLWLGRRGRGPPPARTCTPSAKAQNQRSLRLEAGNDAPVGEPRSPEVGRDPQSTKFTEQHQLPRSDQRGDPQALAASTIGQLRPLRNSSCYPAS